MAVQKKLQKSTKKRPAYPPKLKKHTTVPPQSPEKLVLDQATGTIAPVMPTAAQSTRSSESQPAPKQPPVEKPAASDTSTPSTTSTSSTPPLSPDVSVPTVDPNAPLKIEATEHNASENSGVPTIEQNAPLKMEEAVHNVSGSSEPPTVPNNAPLKIEEVEPILETDPNEGSNKRIFLIALTVAGLISFASIGIFLYQSMINASNEKAASPPTPSAAPSPTPTPMFQPSEIPFEVQNGSGVSGEAAKAAEKVKTLGFPVVKVGNSDRSNYQNTELIISEDIASISAELLKSLEKEFTIGTTSTTLKNTTASALLIIGRE